MRTLVLATLALAAAPSLCLAQELPLKVGQTAAELALGREGFRDVARLQRRGGVWVAEATAPGGIRSRVVVDGTSGDVAGVRPIAGHGPGAEASN
jgi:hypothetical protein